MPTIDEYLKNVTPSQKATIEQFRKMVKELVPEAGEKISYGIPTFTYKGTYLIYIAAFKNHMSIFPASDGMVEAIGEELGKFRVAKGTFRFTEKQPIPDRILKQIITFRKASIDHDKPDRT